MLVVAAVAKQLWFSSNELLLDKPTSLDNLVEEEIGARLMVDDPKRNLSELGSKVNDTSLRDRTARPGSEESNCCKSFGRANAVGRAVAGCASSLILVPMVQVGVPISAS